MFKARIYLAGLMLAVVASAAHADVTLTPAVTTDYDYRGISQSAHRSALQLGADWNQGAFHADTWASTIQWGPAYRGNLEWDAQVDYTVGSDDTAKVQVGVLEYTYPSMRRFNTTEPWVTISRGWFSASAHYSNNWYAAGKAWYFEGNGNIPLGQTGYTFVAHVGQSTGDAWNGKNNPPAYTDWSLSVTKTFFGKLTGAVKYVTSDAPELTTGQSLVTYGYRHAFETRDRVILTISTTLPWASK